MYRLLANTKNCRYGHADTFECLVWPSVFSVIDAPIHYNALENLAGFFGRDMPVHRHAQYLQIHYIDRGDISFHIDDKIYHVRGPGLILMPPSVPHSFLTKPDARGHVLTIHQSIVWQQLIHISRLSAKEAESTAVNNDDLQIFRRFSDLIEEHFREHWHLPEYTDRLGISESRLHQICQRISNRSPKKLTHDRIMQETKRHAGVTAKRYRSQQQ